MPLSKTLYWPSGTCRKTDYAENDVLVFFMFPKYLTISKLIKDNMSKTIMSNVSSTIINEDKWLDIFINAYQQRLSPTEFIKDLGLFFNLENPRKIFDPAPETDSRVIEFSKNAQTLPPEQLDGFIDSFPISKQHFRRIFKREAGTTISQYKIHHMMLSIVLFKALGQSMTDSSINAGFYDISHAYKSHLNAYGISYASTLSASDILIDPDLLSLFKSLKT